jgi:hypothetical protein
MPRNTKQTTTQETKAVKEQPKTQVPQPKAPKKGRTLASKLNAVMYTTLHNDMLGPNDGKITSPGVLANAISQAGAMTPDQAEELLRGWLDQRFGKTHNQSGWIMFSGQNRAKVVAELGSNKVADVGVRLGAMWKGLSADEKQVYNDQAKELNSGHSLPDYAPVSRRKASGSGSGSEAEVDDEQEEETPEPVTPPQKKVEAKTPKAPKKPAKKVVEDDDEISDDDE